MCLQTYSQLKNKKHTRRKEHLSRQHRSDLSSSRCFWLRVLVHMHIGLPHSWSILAFWGAGFRCNVRSACRRHSRCRRALRPGTGSLVAPKTKRRKIPQQLTDHSVCLKMGLARKICPKSIRSYKKQLPSSSLTHRLSRLSTTRCASAVISSTLLHANRVVGHLGPAS